MQVQTPVIQVDGPHHRCLPVADALLGVDEARRIFIDPDAVPHQSRIVGPGHLEHRLFIRDPRCNEPHVHAALGSQPQLPALVADDQIGRRKVYIILGILYHVHVYVLTHRLAVQGIVAVGLYKAAALCRITGIRQIPGKIRICHLHGIPHFQEQNRQILYGVALQPDARILPVAVGACQIEILIRQIIASGEAHLSVHHCDLPVIPVVHEHMKHGHHGVKYPALDPVGLHPFNEFGADEAHASHVVVQETYLHPFLYLTGQDLPDPRKGGAVLNGMVFHEDKGLCL